MVSLYNGPHYHAEAFGVADEEPPVVVRGEVGLMTALWLGNLLTEVVRQSRSAALATSPM